ncbi:MAG: glycosyltransferase family 4 protein [Thermoleophilaceae bacterium]|nr:glycosyltransferase family 4 protein [Thermoleophilaceae bacterium]
MRVLFDCSIVRGEQGGIRTFARGLMSSLETFEGVDALIVAPAESARTWAGHGDLVATIDGAESTLKRAVWRERHLVKLAKAHQAAAIVIPAPEGLLRSSDVPVINVIHDVGPLVAPDVYGRSRWAKYRFSLPIYVKSARVTVCVSAATRHDLDRSIGARRFSDIRVIGQGHQFDRPGMSFEDNPEAVFPFDRFALHVGAALPHKNLETAARAFSGPGVAGLDGLVLIGPNEGDTVETVMNTVRVLGVADRVKHLGYVDPGVLAAAYRQARVLVLPTLHEGFGIPLIEALAQQKRIVASDLPVFREVGGEIPTYVSKPLDPDEWRRKIALSLASAPPDEEACKEAIARYSWKETADQWKRLLEEVT